MAIATAFHVSNNGVDSDYRNASNNGQKPSFPLQLQLMNIQSALRSAFLAEPVPPEVFQQDTRRDEFYQDVSAQLLAKRWTDVNTDSWNALPTPHVLMRYLTPQALHYYLPSLLLAAWDEPGCFDLGIQALSPNNRKGDIRGSWWPEYRALFTSEQQDIVERFLEHVADEEGSLGIEASSSAKVKEMFWTSAKS